MTCPDVIDLERFVLRDLDDEAHSSIASHLSTCDQCAHEIQELGENLRLAPALRRDAAPVDFNWSAPVATESDARIGPYRILRKLGQGGMGSVFEAEQENPRRVVALKIIRPGLVSPSLLARFRHEAQTLGRLLHPGIAQIYEAGAHQTPDGPQPYFAMEVVHGESLVKYAQSHRLFPAQRLELIARVCDAVQHAHQRGVIHRDLKPDNILIDDTGGEPQPKILDFGVARVVDPSGQSTTLHTSAGQIVGTVAYMSPEQASADPAETDTRADVYALGVICFQLLADRLPYRLNNASVAESIRVIVQDEPTQLSTLDRRLKGDVTTIVGKALEKDKSRRYQSAAEMAADIRRYLRDEPITAHPPSAIYQVRKFARRHKGLVGGIAAAFVLLVLGIIGTTIGKVRADRARVVAEKLRVVADRSAAEARSEAAKQAAVTQFMKEMLASASPRNLSATDRAKGRNVTVLEALNEANRKVDAGSFKDQPQIELAIRETMSATYEELAQYDLAAKNMEVGLALARKLYGEEHRDVANNLNSLAVVKHHQGKLAEAEQLSRESLAIYSKIFGADDIGAATVYNNLAGILQHQGRLTDAEAMLRRALEIRRKEYGDDSPELSAVLNNIGTVLSDQGKYADAEAMYRETLRILRRSRGEEHPDIAAGMHNLASVLKEQDKRDEAEVLFREALAMQRKLVGDDHPNLAFQMNNLARFLTEQKKYDEAEQLYKDAMAVHRKTFGEDTPTMATLLNNLGTFYDALDRFDEAEDTFRKTLVLRRRLLGEDHPDTALSMHNLAYVLVEKHEAADAEPLYRQGLAIRVARLGENHPDTAANHMQLGDCLTKLGRYEEAEQELLAAFRFYEPAVATRNRSALSNVNYLITLYKAWGKPEQAKAIRAKVPQHAFGGDTSRRDQSAAR